MLQWCFISRRIEHMSRRRPFPAGLYSGPSYSPPAYLECPTLFVGRDMKTEPQWSRREAIRKGQGRVVCSENSVGIFGYRACYYIPYPFWKRCKNLLAWWLVQHRGALSPARLIDKWFARKYLKRLRRLQAERRKAEGKKTDSHFLR